jgi:trimethylamine:corrinoid methyltransferase-like protein
MENRDLWEQSGSEDILTRANKEFKKRLSEATETNLEKGTEKELRDYMKLAIELNRQNLG